MPIPKQAYAGEIPSLQLDRWERNRQLSIVHERCRQIGQEIFELSCELQKRFDIKDVEEALPLVREWKTLKACEERLMQWEVEWRN